MLVKILHDERKNCICFQDLYTSFMMQSFFINFFSINRTLNKILTSPKKLISSHSDDLPVIDRNLSHTTYLIAFSAVDRWYIYAYLSCTVLAII
jgi:hypothetical protein